MREDVLTAEGMNTSKQQPIELGRHALPTMIECYEVISESSS